MTINLKTSEANKDRVVELTARLGNNIKENVVARIAIAYSLARGYQLDPAKDLRDSKGKEYKEDTLLGTQYRNLYVALICQHYGIHKTDGNVPRYIKMHLDHGLELMSKIFAENRNYTSIEFLLDYATEGIEALEDAAVGPEPVKNFNQRIQKGLFTGPLPICVGTDPTTGQPITATFNDVSLHNNAHIAVAGESVSGKTQFALSLLKQVADVAGGQLNFLYLDFTGLKKDDLPFYQPFFDATRAEYLDAPQTPFPLNPLTFIDNVNEKNKLMGINKFVDIMLSYAPKMGSTQAQRLKEATRDAFNAKSGGAYPSFAAIPGQFFSVTGGQAATKTPQNENLSEYELFAPATDPNQSFLNRNIYLSLSGDLDRTVRFTATFLTINYIYNTFMNMENAPVENGHQALRYVLLIDEAHVIFKDRKSQDLLEKMLREIRSKGVMVVLLSQGIEEFNQPSFDFSSMCENAFLINIKDKTNTNQMKRFLGFGDPEGLILARSMGKIGKGQAVSNLKEYRRGELMGLEGFNK
ncbi:MAG: DndE family protein [Rudanella sp.]|nr:DndE family protein [Rudanella sp.]